MILEKVFKLINKDKLKKKSIYKIIKIKSKKKRANVIESKSSLG
jgi:hypothetical protein